MTDRHMADSDDIRSSLRCILGRKWKDKYIYNYWLAKNKPEGYTVLPAVIGDDYFDRTSNPLRILFVGRSLNGWEKIPGISEQADLDTVLSAVFNQADAVNEFLDSLKLGHSNGKTSSLKRSAFWRMVRMILNKNTETVGYWNENNWQKRIAWANVYCVSPQEAGNPDWDLIAEGRANDYTKLLKAEIDYLCPDVIILITATNKRMAQTDDAWLHEPFMSIFTTKAKNQGDIVNNQDDIVEIDQYKKAKVFIVKRPETKSYCRLQNTVKSIYSIILQ